MKRIFGADVVVPNGVNTQWLRQYRRARSPVCWLSLPELEAVVGTRLGAATSTLNHEHVVQTGRGTYVEADSAMWLLGTVGYTECAALRERLRAAWVRVEERDEVDLTGGKGQANFQIRLGKRGRAHHADGHRRKIQRLSDEYFALYDPSEPSSSALERVQRNYSDPTVAPVQQEQLKSVSGLRKSTPRDCISEHLKRIEFEVGRAEEAALADSGGGRGRGLATTDGMDPHEAEQCTQECSTPDCMEVETIAPDTHTPTAEVDTDTASALEAVEDEVDKSPRVETGVEGSDVTGGEVTGGEESSTASAQEKEESAIGGRPVVSSWRQNPVRGALSWLKTNVVGGARLITKSTFSGAIVYVPMAMFMYSHGALDVPRVTEFLREHGLIFETVGNGLLQLGDSALTLQ